MNEFSINTFDNLKLSMASADINNPKAVVQIVHGLKEHKKDIMILLHILKIMDMLYLCLITEDMDILLMMIIH